MGATLAGIAMMVDWQGERLVPGDTSPDEFACHLSRYLFSVDYVQDKTILDAATGPGYGAYFLATRGAKRVFGVDRSTEAVAFACRMYAADNARYVVMNVERMGFGDDSFDLVVSFETLEHVGDVEAFVSEIARVLKTSGAAIISTPNRKFYSDIGLTNEFHLREMNAGEFMALLETNFESYDILYQCFPDVPLHRDPCIVRLLRRMKISRLVSTAAKRRMRNVAQRRFTGKNYDEFIRYYSQILRSYAVDKADAAVMNGRRGNFVAVAYGPRK